MSQKVYIALQDIEDARPIIEAITDDNPHAVLLKYPAMVRIEAEGKLVIKRETIEEKVGRDFDLQELHLTLITLGGNIDETDDEFILQWKN
ncbi:MAG: MmoB/DmpM family protein [SAR324 cluster bacterium]|nr:MmoB/DmpM family protein [SAR324 cluster bacterium]